ncbi:hypothetical protein GCM10011386_45630 [Parapedobacter defluvii]|uniref:Cardiolipin synthase N-terminal domain-containing protein n=1 Tax=Parapedobacter defluvii TaxID=2045106 RepID=A0ABQ1MWP7_9SPHI|nr:PLDc N-terminal domain-containing protein [Parapedobacter defluvii]RQP16980.1 MAG: hypothetical protein EAS52_10105 [Parapedobacter sp.]GGC48282.1 hypothetical protein GCM10011386_45630 [Parapedobacter defluvii]
MELLFLNMGTMELIIALPVMVFMLYSLFHAATNMGIPGLHRLIWGLVILSIPILGSIAYWVMGRKPVGHRS